MHLVGAVLLLLLIVALSNLLARLVRIPLPLLQIALGAGAALAGLQVSLDPGLFLLLFISPLLFADAFRIPKREFVELHRMILLLALGLVLFTVVGAGYFVHWLLPAISLPAAFALAAVLSPTDAVATSAIIGGARVPRRMTHILQGEALMNDATGLVSFKFAVAAVMTGTFSMSHAVASFVVIAVGGLAVGGATAWGFAIIDRRVLGWSGEDPGTQITLLVLLPFAAYLAAEHLGMSGILAAVGAGMVMNYVDPFGETQIITRLRTKSVWSMIEFAFNGVIFLLLGLQFPAIIRRLQADAPAENSHILLLFAYVPAITLSLIVLRFAWIWVPLLFEPMLTRFRHHQYVTGPGLQLVCAMALAGVRGAVTLAGILSLPLHLSDGARFPSRDLMIAIAMGVIVCSLLISSISLPLVLRGVEMPADNPMETEARRARLAMAEAAIRGVNRAQQRMAAGEGDIRKTIVAEVGANVLAIYRQRLEDDGAANGASGLTAHRIEMALRLTALRAERAELKSLRETDRINDQTARMLLRELDLEQAAILETARALPR